MNQLIFTEKPTKSTMYRFSSQTIRNDKLLLFLEGFDRRFWGYVAEALCALSRDFPLKRHKWDTISAWRIIVLFIVKKLEYGFQLGINSMKSDQSFDNPCYKV